MINQNKVPSTLESIHNLIINKSNDFLLKDNVIGLGYKGYFQTVPNKDLGKEYLSLLYKYFTNPFFINTASNYLGDKALLTKINIRISPKVKDINKKFEGSQLWHSDHHDSKMLKIFILLKDVNSNSGPLEVLNKQMTKKIMKDTNYDCYSKNSHSDSLVNTNHEYDVMTGSKDSIIIVDTVSCFHRGSRMQTEDRLILEANYLSRTSFRYPLLTG